MSPHSLPKRAAVIALVLAAAFCGGVSAIRTAFPPRRPPDSPRLAQLRDEQARLASYTDAAAQALEARLADLRAKLWTEESFARWRNGEVPGGWTVQDLGTADLKHLRGRRLAFQKPNATDRDWPEIAAFLGRLEQSPGTSVQSAALAVQPGYIGSRRFSECLFIAVFYFAGGEVQPR